MIVVNEKPPLFADICAVFPGATGDVIFAWGDRIFNPRNIKVRSELIAYEQAHGRRQGTTEHSIEAWWREYLASAEFRLNEEIIGHRAELQALKAMTPDRRFHGRMALHVAAKLASPLYGALINKPAAMRALLARAAP